ncbi:Transposon Ty3-I Gag-Pol polyprotein [Cucumis melo var. makuwa]|uniref:Transposon Ty3-I Gag-Pol polyprotein n=1 Tax=Cucumis melo var. makuwa TaxID=1194695 RepID=A0A5D3E123_CUCMM|nr:Transposon Ty3-I Gag-Pol polyprotein [Cucumis melo var. makuwa]TYK29331.1 Transposon Ty3-I Gag-Pol polyprotein [Cucumis melo var. makuwa]
MIEMKKTMERLAEDMRESHSYKKKEEYGTSDGSVMNLKGKMEELDVTAEGRRVWEQGSFAFSKMDLTMRLELALQAEVVSRHPQTLEDCMKEAQLVNDRNLALKLAIAELGILEPKGGESSATKITIPLKGSYQKGKPPVKRLSDVEFRAHLDQGLCFRCNEKYSHGHRCKIKEKRELVLFILNEEESVEEGEISKVKEEERVELKQLDITKEAEVEYRAITNLTKGTTKMKGYVKSKEVIVLIDSGATHNFIHQALVDEKKLPMEKDTQFSVTTGDVELGKVDVVLGMQWLDTTGTMKVPRGLPPKRAIDHRILTLPEQRPINVRPYKYGYEQKEEIEKLVAEMLQARVIRPSHSPYSSPVLLVKKKDGGWRFCVDYRKLNQATVSDKFPIPVIEELLDELHGATIFSKLDLKSGYHQIRMKEEDIEKTAFRTHEEH